MLHDHRRNPLFVDLGWLFGLGLKPSIWDGSNALHASPAASFYSLNVAVRGDIFVLLSQFLISA